MRRDVCYYLEADVVSVYNAYLAAAKGSKFDRTCEEHPYHSFSFGVNYSMMYNMNGGSCTLRFMPYGSGCAVNLRFSLAQLAGARYEKYAQNLTEIAQANLGRPAKLCQIDVEEFLRPENMLIPDGRQPALKVVAPAGTVSAPDRSCGKCGAPAAANALFCANCGSKLEEQKKALFCSRCGTKLTPDAKFCAQCGNKVN